MKKDDRIRVRRLPNRGFYDEETIHSILDKYSICHVSFVHNNYPVVIPTLFGRKDNYIYLHGSSASRMMKNLESGLPLSCCVTGVNGIVLARSAFHHSLNYESVIIFGTANLIESKDEKLSALKCISEHIIPGRWAEVRQPTDIELKATKVLKLSLSEASAKIRTGDPSDDKEDYQLDIWAGVVPIHQSYGNAITDPLMQKEVPIPDSVKNLLKST